MHVEVRSQQAFDAHWARGGAVVEDQSWRPADGDGVRAFHRAYLRPGQRVLELGAGSGASLHHIQSEYGVDAVGVDLSLHACRALNRIAAGCAMDAFRLGFKAGSFDAVYSVGLFEHFQPVNLSALMRESVRVTRPGGVVMVDVPYAWNLYTVYKRSLMALRRWGPGWEREFQRRELRGLFRSVGLVVESTTLHGPFLHPHLRPLVAKRAKSLLPAYDAVGRVVPSPRNQFVTVVGRKPVS